MLLSSEFPIFGNFKTVGITIVSDSYSIHIVFYYIFSIQVSNNLIIQGSHIIHQVNMGVILEFSVKITSKMSLGLFFGFLGIVKNFFAITH